VGEVSLVREEPLCNYATAQSASPLVDGGLWADEEVLEAGSPGKTQSYDFLIMFVTSPYSFNAA
jgi:hypothetical protein